MKFSTVYCKYNKRNEFMIKQKPTASFLYLAIPFSLYKFVIHIIMYYKVTLNYKTFYPVNI